MHTSVHFQQHSYNKNNTVLISENPDFVFKYCFFFFYINVDQFYFTFFLDVSLMPEYYGLLISL